MAVAELVLPGQQQSSGRKQVKAGGFLNLSLSRGGKLNKVCEGTLYFDEADPGQMALFEFLQTPEGIEAFRAGVVITANRNVDKGSKAGFDLLGA